MEGGRRRRPRKEKGRGCCRAFLDGDKAESGALVRLRGESGCGGIGEFVCSDGDELGALVVGVAAAAVVVVILSAGIWTGRQNFTAFAGTVLEILHGRRWRVQVGDGVGIPEAGGEITRIEGDIVEVRGFFLSRFFQGMEREMEVLQEFATEWPGKTRCGENVVLRVVSGRISYESLSIRAGIIRSRIN